MKKVKINLSTETITTPDLPSTPIRAITEDVAEIWNNVGSVYIPNGNCELSIQEKEDMLHIHMFPLSNSDSG